MIWKISLNDFFIISGIIHVSLIFYHIDHNKQSSLLQLYLVYRCMKLMQTQNLCFYCGFLYSYILIWFETFGQEISQAYFHLLVICFNNYVALKWLLTIRLKFKFLHEYIHVYLSTGTISLQNKPKYLYIYKCSNALIPMIFVKIPVWTVNVDVQALF